jgi:putative tricarboxylic transport membrane protein
VFGVGQWLTEIGVQPSDVKMAVFDGGPPALLALTSGAVDFAMQNPPEALPLIQAGELKPLMVTGSERALELPDVPSATELGYETVTASGWVGYAGPAGLPSHVISAWEAGLKAALADEGVQQRFAAIGGTPVHMGADAFGTFLRTEHEKATEIAASLGLTGN